MLIIQKHRSVSKCAVDNILRMLSLKKEKYVLQNMYRHYSNCKILHYLDLQLGLQ